MEFVAAFFGLISTISVHNSTEDPDRMQQQQSTSLSLSQLLHAADTLSLQFNALHSSSLSYVHSISSASHQLDNLSAVPDAIVTRSRGTAAGGMKERGMMKVREVIEEGLGGVREELGKMEACLERLNTLTFDADLFLATPSLALQHGLNPHEALKHVSSLFSSYQAELIRLREVLADFTTETIEVEEFEREWRVMKEVDRGVEKDLGELNDVLSAWGAVDSEMN